VSPDSLHRPFRPRRGRFVAWGFTLGLTVVLAALALLSTGQRSVGFRWYDRLGVLVVAAGCAWLLSLFARLRALPAEAGLNVVNLFHSRQLEWAEVVAVRFGGGQPWVMLDLDDGEELAVMAIQRADGELGQAEARRLATLVALHSRTERDD
jgi:hypothetical protein